jgi:hypothetical protein
VEHFTVPNSIDNKVSGSVAEPNTLAYGATLGFPELGERLDHYVNGSTLHFLPKLQSLDLAVNVSQNQTLWLITTMGLRFLIILDILGEPLSLTDLNEKIKIGLTKHNLACS